MDKINGRDGKTESFVRRTPRIMIHQLGYKREMPHPNLIRVTVPTLSYEGLDYTGKKMLPWSLLKLLDSCEVNDFWPVREHEYGPDIVSVFYMMNFELNVDHTFYLLDSPKFPLTIESRITFLKKSSRCVKYNLRHASLQNPYAVMSRIVVNMDPALRTPKPFPAWWKDRFKFPDQRKRREFMLPPKPSDDVFSSQHRVVFSDIDINKHTNYTVYVRMAFNSMCEHILAGNYGKGLDVYEIGLRSLQCTFKNECGIGDILTVSSWACQDKKDTFYFELCNGNILCATLSMSFYNMLDEQTLVSNL